MGLIPPFLFDPLFLVSLLHWEDGSALYTPLRSSDFRLFSHNSKSVINNRHRYRLIKYSFESKSSNQRQKKNKNKEIKRGDRKTEWHQSRTTFKTINNHKYGGFKGKHFPGVYIGPLRLCNLVVEIHKFMNYSVTAPVLIALFLFLFFRRVPMVAAHHPSTCPFFVFLGWLEAIVLLFLDLYLLWIKFIW